MSAIKSSINDSIKGIVDVVKQISTAFEKSLTDPIGKVAKLLGDPKAKTGAGALAGFVKGIGENINNLVNGTTIVTGVLDVLGQFLNAINPFVPIMQTLSDIFGVYADIIAAKLAPIMQKLYEVLLSPEVLNLISLLGDLFVELFKALLPILKPLTDLAVMVLTPLLTIVKDILKWLGDMNIPFAIFQGIIIALAGPIYAIQFVFEAFFNFLKAIPNAFILIINAVIATINLILNLLTLGLWPDLPEVPYLDSGGTIEGSGLAVVHKNEQVLNPAETELYKAMVDRSTTTNSGGNIEVVINNYGAIGVDEITDQIADKVGEKLARSGVINRG